MFTGYIFQSSTKEVAEVKFFECEVDVQDRKNDPPSHEISAWVVKGENEETVRLRIHEHFKENRMIGKYKIIVSISFSEIFLKDNEDIEEHLEERGCSGTNVLF